MKNFLSVIIFGTLVPVFSCYAEQLMDKKAISSLEVSAKQGDDNSAFQLYKYYSLEALDETNAEFWLSVAASMGHSIAALDLVHKNIERVNSKNFYYYESLLTTVSKTKNYEDVAYAHRLLGELYAQKNGYPNSNEALNHFFIAYGYGDSIAWWRIVELMGESNDLFIINRCADLVNERLRFLKASGAGESVAYEELVVIKNKIEKKRDQTSK